LPPNSFQLIEAIGVLDAVYSRTAKQLIAALELLLIHETLVLQEADVVGAALTHFRAKPALGFSDCLVLEIARKAGHRRTAHTRPAGHRTSSGGGCWRNALDWSSTATCMPVLNRERTSARPMPPQPPATITRAPGGGPIRDGSSGAGADATEAKSAGPDSVACLSIADTLKESRR